MMLTVTKLARRCGLSRTTVLYYESVGLLKRAPRTPGNYRRYGEQELARLQQICAYRNAGMKLADIRAILDRAGNEAAGVLKRRLVELDAEIETLRSHQRTIARLLQSETDFGRNNVITKDKWVEIMRASGFTESDMHRWHKEFEKAAPGEHQEFLEFLRIQPEEIRSIRDWSRNEEAVS